jgi:hypothetical protein
LLLAGRETIVNTLAEFLTALEGLSAEGLNWRPPADETNSIAVLATHALGSTRSWLAVALGEPLPPRDRAGEFLSRAPETGAFLAEAGSIAADCRLLLETDKVIDWSAIRKTHARPNPADPDRVPAAWALLHAIEHLREHLAQVMLTRQLFLSKSKEGDRP